jgi:hypothetical protein
LEEETRTAGSDCVCCNVTNGDALRVLKIEDILVRCGISMGAQAGCMQIKKYAQPTFANVSPAVKHRSAAFELSQFARRQSFTNQ